MAVGSRSEYGIAPLTGSRFSPEILSLRRPLGRLRCRVKERMRRLGAPAFDPARTICVWQFHPPGVTAMQQFLFRTSHRPRPLPSGRWAMTQRWNDLLFANWPLPPKTLSAVLPADLQPDLWQGTAWLGVAPFWVDRFRLRGLPAVSGGQSTPGLNLRAYVRHRQTGMSGILLLSLETGSLLTAGLGRALYHLPFHLAEMDLVQRREREFAFYSRRRFSRHRVLFKARYRGLGPTRKLAELRPGTLESFLLDRPSIFIAGRNGQSVRANLHYVNSPLEEAEAEIEFNDLPAAAGLPLPDSRPVLYYARRMAAYIWPFEPAAAAIAARPVTVPVTQS
jgi:uncharacterized protein YqjF (DUF2071 family)